MTMTYSQTDQVISPQALKPTTSAQRIQAMDIIRGISLLGILLMNIVGFGLYRAYEDPSNSGGSTGWDLNVWWMNALFFEGTMRGMFSMLFGAGILLFTSRKSEHTEGNLVTDLFFRRLMWMVLFGVIHCYLLLWEGEILYCYGLVGMFAFSFRHLNPRNLIIGAAVIFAVAGILGVKDYVQVKESYEKATAAHRKMSGQTLNKEETAAIANWDAKTAEMKVTPDQVKEEMKARSKGYWSIVKHKLPVNEYMQTTFMYRLNFLDTLAMMLLGMAFLKLGILKAARTTQFYLLMVLIGYSVGVTVNYFEGINIVEKNFSILSFQESAITYNVGRIAITCGHIGLIMLLINSGKLMFLQKAWAAVGQTAFSNYILQTLICNFIFLGYGLSMFGKLHRYELYYIVVSVWIIQLIVSPIWLKYFRFGPLEWVWRSLTYWERQPLKRAVQSPDKA